jgi:hypothetical protein
MRYIASFSINDAALMSRAYCDSVIRQLVHLGMQIGYLPHGLVVLLLQELKLRHKPCGRRPFPFATHQEHKTILAEIFARRSRSIAASAYDAATQRKSSGLMAQRTFEARRFDW